MASHTFSMGTFIVNIQGTQHKVSLIQFLPKRRIIATLDNNTELLISLLGGKNARYSILHGEPHNVQLLVNILRRRGIQLPSITNVNVDNLEYEIIDNCHSTGNTIYIRTGRHIFAATVTEAPYHYFLKVGGNTFSKCVEIFVNKDGENTLAQINSEPECGVDSPLLEGESVDMTKGALQLAGILLDAYVFEFIDNSSIECAPTKQNRPPPRSNLIPFSLAHLYFMTRGRTWYDINFNAQLKSTEHRKKYKDGADILRNKPDLTFDALAPKMRLEKEQLDEIKPYFENATTWMDFFSSVPKARRCILLSWAPAFVDRLIDFEICRSPWLIDTRNMSHVELSFYSFSQHGGKQRRRRSRRLVVSGTKKQKLFVARLSSRQRGMQIL